MKYTNFNSIRLLKELLYDVNNESSLCNLLKFIDENYIVHDVFLVYCNIIQQLLEMNLIKQNSRTYAAILFVVLHFIRIPIHILLLK